MRLVFGFIFVFVLSVIFSYFQGFIDFLIQLGIFPERYMNSSNFDIMMIFILYLLFMVAAFVIAVVLALAGRYFDQTQKRRYKRAKKQAIAEFGTAAPYFYLLDPHDMGVNFDKSCYVFEIIQSYLFEKYQDWGKVEEVISNLSNVEYLKLYHEAIEYYGLPDIPKEYGIFNQFTDEELALFSK